MVRRLVEQQDVHVVGRELGEGQAAALAAAERAHRLVDAVAAEEEARQEVTRVLQRHVAGRQQLVEHRAALVEVLGALAVVARPGVGAEDDAALRRAGARS